jgi:hypothetical protein
MSEKTCTVCKLPWPLSAFSRRGDGHRSNCKKCDGEDRAKRYRRHATGTDEPKLGKSHRWIAAQLGISKSWVQILERRGLAKLRAACAEGWR